MIGLAAWLRLAALGSAVAIAACVAEPAASGPPGSALGRPAPGPGPQARAVGYDAVRENAACERCHENVAAEWRSSLHSASWSDPVFLAAYAVEPLAFCKHCHAPELGTEPAAHDQRRHLGVGCVTCHVTDDRILGTRDIAARQGAHAVTRSTDMSGSGWCAGCHQFEFPESQEAPMQGTLEEHAASPARDRSCQDCHMPAAVDGAPGRRSHAFRVFGDVGLLRSSVAAEVRREGDRGLVVSLRARDVGHAVPTGDMFRRLEVHARAGAGDDLMTATPVVLARSFVREPTADGTRRRQVLDTRVPSSGEAREAQLFFPRSTEGVAIEWEVVYRRMGPHEAALFGVDLASEAIVIASGTLGVGAGRDEQP